MPARRQPVKARAPRDRLRRLAALTACRRAGALPQSDQGLLCANALKLQRKRECAALQRDVACTSAVLWIGQACHSRAMGRSHKSCRRDAPADAPIVDLYDYTAAPDRHRRRQTKRVATTWTVTDDWPKDVPVTEAEIDVFEAWFGDLFDELFGKS